LHINCTSNGFGFFSSHTGRFAYISHETLRQSSTAAFRLMQFFFYEKVTYLPCSPFKKKLHHIHLLSLQSVVHVVCFRLCILAQIKILKTNICGVVGLRCANKHSKPDPREVTTLQSFSLTNGEREESCKML
jgi:hypothetical protein